MKKNLYTLITIVILSMLVTGRVFGQNWLDHLTIAQSMATSDQQALPAQFNITFPKNKSAALLINLGANYNIGKLGNNGILAVSGEYHRNSMTDSVQNNLQLGFNANLLLGSHGNSMYFLIADPKYSWDGVAKSHTAESNILLAPKWTMDPLNIGRKTQAFDYSTTKYFSLYAGTQVQQVFASDTTSPKGFKLRPLVKAIASFTWNRHRDGSSTVYDQSKPLITIYADYAERRTAVNSTNDGERFSHLLNTGANYYFPTKKILVSFGLAFVEGADHFSGLKSQQYFLASLNVSTPAK